MLKLTDKQLKALRDNPRNDYKLRRAAANLLEAKQADTIRAGYASNTRR